MNITVMGLGYVGAVTLGCLSKNHNITGVDIVQSKVDIINDQKSPVIEPGLSDLIKNSYKKGRLKAIHDRQLSLERTDVVIICVGTPSHASGYVDLSSLTSVTQRLCELLNGAGKKPALIYRCTVPPGTMRSVIYTMIHNYGTPVDFPIIYHPEFLREGSAVSDFLENPQVVVAPVDGVDEAGVEKLFEEIYADIEYRFYCVDVKTAEMIKYLNNSYHALKVSFANEIARLCVLNDIDTQGLFKIFMDDDKLNISRAYLTPGFAYGGSCLPKDLRGMIALARQLNLDMPIVTSIERSNEMHIDIAFQRIMETKLNKIGFYGLSFKPNTDDTRESPYVKLIEKLIGKGKEIAIFDESINPNTITGRNLEYLTEHIPHISNRLVKNIDELTCFSQIIVLCHYKQKIVDICKSDDSQILIDMTGKLSMVELSDGIRSLVVPDKMKKSIL